MDSYSCEGWCGVLALLLWEWRLGPGWAKVTFPLLEATALPLLQATMKAVTAVTAVTAATAATAGIAAIAGIAGIAAIRRGCGLCAVELADAYAPGGSGAVCLALTKSSPWKMVSH